MNTLNYKNFTFYAASTLKSMTKDELVEYIHCLQHNWCSSDEANYNMANYAETLEKALDKACEELENLSYVKGLGQVGMCYAEWKEYLLKKVKE